MCINNKIRFCHAANLLAIFSAASSTQLFQPIQVDEEGNLIASYNTDTAFAEPEQCCFDGDTIVILMYNNLSTHRMIDLYAISEDKPYPAWRSPQWGLDYIFVDTETESLMRERNHNGSSVCKSCWIILTSRRFSPREADMVPHR